MAGIAVKQTELEEILPLRTLFLQENNFQIRYNACHERGWTDSYLLTLDDSAIGYSSVNGQEIKNRDTIFEFYLIPAHRKLASRIFPELLKASAVSYIECQSNDFLLSSMLYEFSEHINADYVLWEDHTTTEYTHPDVIFRSARKGDTMQNVEEMGGYVLERDGEIVATGGFLLHYNMPFADLYMEVREDCRRDGLGTFLLQEVKKACYLHGRVPAARCPIRHHASRSTLRKAGLRECGFMLKGNIPKNT